MFAATAFFLGFATLAVLWKPILAALPENDLWWMIPVLSQYISGKSPLEVAAFLIDPNPIRLAPPVLKTLLLPLTPQVGWAVGPLIGVSVLLHFLNAGLIYGLVRVFRMPRRIAALSACTYLTMFAHFHAILWPTASQHLFAVFCILLWLVLYFQAEKRIEEGRPHRWLYGASLLVSGLASLQRSTFIAPALIAFHIFFFSRDPLQKAERYRRWSPQCFLFLVYPILVITLAGDVVVTESIRKVFIPDFFKAFLVTDPMVPDRYPRAVKAVVVLATAAAFLFSGRKLAALRLPRRDRRWGYGAASVFLGTVYLAMCLQDTRQALLPYNLLIPFLSCLTSFLEPLQAAFLIDSTEPFHYVPPQVSAWALLGSVAVLWIFIGAWVKRNRALSLLGLWYLLNLVLLTHQDTSFPPLTPSRYFIYFSPIFAIVFPAVAVTLLERLGSFLKLRPPGKSAMVCALWTLLCLLNLAAIRVELFRGKLSNTYLLYDHYRIAHAIDQDLPRAGGPPAPRSARVKGLEGLPFRAPWAWDQFPFDVPTTYDHLRFISPLFGPLKLSAVPPSPPGEGKDAAYTYTVQEERLVDSQGRTVGEFSRFLEEAQQALASSNPERALALLESAIRTRPFLLTYLLPDLRRMDLRWITGGSSLRDWAARIDARYNPEEEFRGARIEQTARVIQKEISDYELCLFLYAYLKDRAGQVEESRYWISELQFFDKDPEHLIERIRQHPRVGSDPALRSFLERLLDPFFFMDPYSVKKEDYAVGRFLVRLLLGRDLRSSWDTRATKIL